MNQRSRWGAVAVLKLKRALRVHHAELLLRIAFCLILRLLLLYLVAALLFRAMQQDESSANGIFPLTCGYWNKTIMLVALVL